MHGSRWTAQLLKDRFDQAIAAASALADEALAANPDFALAHYAKARSLPQTGDVEGARARDPNGRGLARGLSTRERNQLDIVCRAVHGESTTALGLLRERAAAHPC